MGRPRTTKEQKREAHRAISAKYYAAHSRRAQEASKRWRDKNRKRVNEKSREYSKKHREQYRMHCISRRTRKTAAGGSFTVSEWKTLCKKHKHRCLCCTKRRKLTADHVLPISKGGTSNIENIQPLCG